MISALFQQYSVNNTSSQSSFDLRFQEVNATDIVTKMADSLHVMLENKMKALKVQLELFAINEVVITSLSNE